MTTPTAPDPDMLALYLRSDQEEQELERLGQDPGSERRRDHEPTQAASAEAPESTRTTQSSSMAAGPSSPGSAAIPIEGKDAGQ